MTESPPPPLVPTLQDRKTVLQHITNGLNTKIAEQVKILRQERHLSLRDLALAIGCSVHELRCHERGETPISGGRLKLIADAFGVPMDTLTAGTIARGPLASVSPEAARLATYFDAIEDGQTRTALLWLSYWFSIA